MDVWKVLSRGTVQEILHSSVIRGVSEALKTRQAILAIARVYPA